jgi:hypothetical protein
LVRLLLLREDAGDREELIGEQVRNVQALVTEGVLALYAALDGHASAPSARRGQAA